MKRVNEQETKSWWRKKNLSQFLHFTLESRQTKRHQMTKSSAEKNLGEKWKIVANREITQGWVGKIKYIST